MGRGGKTYACMTYSSCARHNVSIKKLLNAQTRTGHTVSLVRKNRWEFLRNANKTGENFDNYIV